ncbi:MAG: FtsW/RodA/SpoVE family cell cycle protein, partial [Synergistaceae bacterium]|nr:FtsW/RodA/SpoVE family cell cycle protein [Synergistaceae bacterium]
MDTPRISTFKEDLAALDKTLLACVTFLILVGVACIFSAGSGNAGRGGEYATRQFGWGVFSVAAYVLVVGIDYRKFMDLAYPIYGATLFLLFITMSIAPNVNGSQSWL